MACSLLRTFLFISVLTIYTEKLTADVVKPVASVITKNILEGDTIKLKCSYLTLDDHPVQYVVWYYDHDEREAVNILYAFNSQFPPDSPSNGTNGWNNRASGSEVSDGYEVIVKNVNVKDNNAVLCVIADNGYGRQTKESEPVPLDIAVKPSEGIIQHRTNLTAKDGEPSSFECVVNRAKPQRSVEISWYIDGQKLEDHSDILKTAILNADFKTYTVTSTLRRRFSKIDNGRNISCDVKWSFKNRNIEEIISTDTGNLNILYPPYWSEKSNIVYTEEISDGTLVCLVKSNPLIQNNINWYLATDTNKRIGTGKTLQLKKVSKANFTTYICEVLYNSIPQQFDVVLMESGPPQLKQMDFLPNMTSRALTLKWLVGSDGGHPPQRYTISIRRQGHKVFNVVKSDIEPTGPEGTKMFYTVNGLDPNIKYEFKIIARNDRKTHFPEKNDQSIGEFINYAVTKKDPEISIKNVVLKPDSLSIDWDYHNILKELEPDKYEVALKVKYGKKGDYEYQFVVHPEDNTIAVTRGSEVISGHFDTSATYVVSLLIYENGAIITSAAKTKEFKKESENPNLWWTILICIGIITFIIAVFLILFFVCRRYRLRRQRGQKRYNDHYLLEKNIYEDIKLKSKPPKLPNRNSSQKDDPISQNNNITALQTVYLTQQISHMPPSATDVGVIPYVPRSGSELEPLNLTPAGEEPNSDYLMPLPTPPIPPVSVQITVNQNNSIPNFTYGNYDNSVRIPVLSENGDELDTFVLPTSPNVDCTYLPMTGSVSTLTRS